MLCAAVCLHCVCSVLQKAAVCCSLLQCAVGRLAEEGNRDVFLELGEQALGVAALEFLEALGYRHHCAFPTARGVLGSNNFQQSLTEMIV